MLLFLGFNTSARYALSGGGELKLILWSNIAFHMNTAMVSLTFEILGVAKNVLESYQHFFAILLFTLDLGRHGSD